MSSYIFRDSLSSPRMHIGKCCESSLGFAWPKEKFPSVGNMQISVSNIMLVLLLSQDSVKKDALNSFSRLSRQSSTMPVFDHVVTLVTDESMEKGFAWPKEKFPSVRYMHISLSNIMSVLLLSQYSVKKDAIVMFFAEVIGHRITHTQVNLNCCVTSVYYQVLQ